MSRAVDLEYRLLEDRDLPGVLALWKSAGWGESSAEEWVAQHRDLPQGRSFIAVAVDEDGVVRGQMILYRSLVWCRPRTVMAVRSAAAIIHPDLRGGVLSEVENPILALHEAAVRAAVEEGAELAYAMPEPLWLPWLQRLHVQYPRRRLAIRRCMEVDTSRVGASAGGLTVAPATEPPGDEYDELWEVAKEGMAIDCATSRSPWRVRMRLDGSILLEAREGSGRLIGYAHIRKRDHLVLDLLAVDREVLARTLVASVGWVGRHADMARVSALEDPAVSGVLEDLGGRPVDYQFIWEWRPIGPVGELDRIDESSWYLTGGE